ncbi:MAG: Rpn family recombination-promoting nuclease/putative transposase [Algicola sp.]|nr:Rpn family recombination-promoting nuclease/putative transposase [Algicola sp.]
MKYFIDPTIDCVFKKILAAAGHENLLLDFLNSILKPIAKIMQIVVQNPYNEKDYLKDKLSIVDIKAQDENGTVYQIEVQVATPEYLAQRMLANWGDIYQGQLTEGVGFSDLKPVISIWLLTSNLIKHSDSCHHHFECYDRHHDVLLSNHMAIHVLELAKWCKPDRLQSEDNWLYFFKEGKSFKVLPPELKKIPQMREAMSVLTAFSDQAENYHRYKTRQQILRIQLSDEQVAKKRKLQLVEAQVATEQAEAATEQAEVATEQAEAATEQAEAATEQAEAATEQERAEKNKYRAMLRKAGIDPDNAP